MSTIKEAQKSVSGAIRGLAAYGRRSVLVVLLVSALGAEACQATSEEDEGATLEMVEAPKVALSTRAKSGPVSVELSLDQSRPVLGDRIELSLRVQAEKDVRVFMPEFGDQLGRFGIVDFQPREVALADGRMEWVQRYTLELPRSGKIRLPSFLVEFIDDRPDSEARGELQEILTEELTIEVASVLRDKADLSKLNPPQGALKALVLERENSSPWPYLGLLALFALALAGLLYRRHRKPMLPPKAADVLALEAIERLADKGIPSDPDGIDLWYVELSDIVRHYIEGRFELHAPRQTTEEFFERVRESQVISFESKALLRRFLGRADRVKFTAYLPSSEESHEALALARTFVEETRPVAAVEEAKVKSPA